MLDSCTIQERWSGVNQMIERWLEERQALIVEFCAAGGIRDAVKSSQQQSLKKFCETLVDYVCAGHFEVYYQLIREAEEFKDGSEEIAKTLLPELTDNTTAAMEFNDFYAKKGNAESLDTLPEKLSALGELLELRFEIEDRLIDVMHTAHKQCISAEA